jgi:hypothetical protein
MTTIKPNPATLRPPRADAPKPEQAAAPPAQRSAPQDGFDTVSPPIDVLNAPSQSDDALSQSERQLTQAASTAAEVFPQPMRRAVTDALAVSISRIRSAKAAGMIDASEASEASEMLRELFEGIKDLRSGEAKVTVRPNDNEGVRVWRLRSPDGDEFQVTARRQLDGFGEARIGFRQVLDDGQRLPGRHRVGLRVDLERFGQAAVDMQFGGSSLDKRVHGLMKNEDGSVFETASGKHLADHHFRNQLPSQLNDPKLFAELVDGFVSGVMQPLEQSS